MTSTAADLQRLRAIPLFYQLECDAIASILTKMNKHTFTSGECVVRQGEIEQSIWLLMVGQCEVTKQVTTGSVSRTVKLAELQPFETFGEMTLFNGLPRSASVLATCDVQALKLGHEDFMEIAQSDPHTGVQLASNMVSIVSQRLQGMDDWLTDVGPVGGGASVDEEWKNIRKRLQSAGHLL